MVGTISVKTTIYYIEGLIEETVYYPDVPQCDVEKGLIQLIIMV